MQTSKPIAFIKAVILLFLFLLGSSTTQAQNCFALDFDGVNDYVEAPAIQQRSVEMWIKADVEAQMGFFSGGRAFAGNQDYELYIYRPGGVGAGTFDVTYGVALVFWGNDVHIPYDAIKSGWHHVAVSWDGNNQVMISVDGNFPDGYLQSSGNTLLSQPFTLSSVPTPNPTFTTLIGGTRSALWGTGSLFFNGQMDEVRIWDHARTQAQIIANMNVQMDGTEPGLLANYSFEEGSGLATADATGNYNGTLTNMNPTTSWVPGIICNPPPPIPTVSEWGLIFLFFGFLSVGSAWIYVRNQEIIPAG